MSQRHTHPKAAAPPQREPRPLDQPDAHAASEHDAVARMLAGADDVTRKKLEPMLQRGSVVERIASVHGATAPAMVEDRPAKPDFLSTSEYSIARRAIGAERASQPAAIVPSRDRDSTAAPAAEPGADVLSVPVQRTPIVWWLALGGAVVIVALLAWWRASAPDPAADANPQPAGTPSNGELAAPPPPRRSVAEATAPAASLEPVPQPVPGGSGDVAPKAPTPRQSTEAPSPPQPSTPATHPTPAPSKGPRFPVQGDDA
jgi:hypothetical protein